MLDPQAWQTLRSSDDKLIVTFIMSVVSGREVQHIKEIRERSDRVRELRHFYKIVKTPFLETMNDYRDCGIRVTNELEGTPNLIASGPLKAWRLLFDKETSFRESPNLKVRPDVEVWTHS